MLPRKESFGEGLSKIGHELLKRGSLGESESKRGSFGKSKLKKGVNLSMLLLIYNYWVVPQTDRAVFFAQCVLGSFTCNL